MFCLWCFFFGFGRSFILQHLPAVTSMNPISLQHLLNNIPAVFRSYYYTTRNVILRSFNTLRFDSSSESLLLLVQFNRSRLRLIFAAYFRFFLIASFFFLYISNRTQCAIRRSIYRRLFVGALIYKRNPSTNNGANKTTK